MLFAGGLVLLALGLASGALLVAAPLGFLPGSAGLTLWILFPVFTIAGYLMAAAPARGATIPLLSRVSGVILLVLALVSAVILVLRGASLIETRSETFSLWYVMAVGLILGATGLGSHGRDREQIEGKTPTGA